ncbi:L,D-transpeptidase [Oscillatoria sp. FACHB-1407]|nr:L,D-transpeptidase [Oscillatoria sp. FACHB-1407]
MQRFEWSKPFPLFSRQVAIALSIGATQVIFGSTPAIANTPLPLTPLHPSFSFSYVDVRIPDLPPLAAPSNYLPTIEEPEPHIVLKLGQRRVYLYQGDRVLASYPVAIGRSDTPTPTGRFQVFQMIENPRWQNPWTGEVTPPGPNSALGVRWIGFTRMPNGIIGFHGTPTLSSIGRAASNGCVRMRNEDVVALFAQIEMGTTVIVEP